MKQILLLLPLTLLLLGCQQSSNIKYDESGLFILVEEDSFIRLEPRIQPNICGMVPDKETAIKIAESVWYPIYGSEIYTELPFTAELEGDTVWFVQGSLPKGMTGGCAEIRLRKSDAAVLYVGHQR